MVDRADELVRRVRWLDRYRRTVAVVCALTIVAIMVFASDWLLGADSPVFYSRILSIFVGVIAWWLIEVGLAWVTALWETEADRLLRDRGLPPMRVVVRK
jgi:hypothetical protein